MSGDGGYRYIRFERPDEAIGVVTLNRPEKRNAFMPAMVDEVRSVIELLGNDLTAKVVILRGAGPAFSSGWDLEEARKEQSRIAGDPSKIMFGEVNVQFTGPVPALLRSLWEAPIISIAAVQGYAIETGLVVALNCDLVVAADDARFFWRPLGGAGMLWHQWPWTIGMRKTKEVLLLGEYVSGKEAAAMNMINRSVAADVLDAEVMTLAKKIAKRPREFNYLDKTVTNQAFEAMGMRTACNTSGIAHVLSHLTSPSMEFNKTASEGSNEDVRTLLDRRADPKEGK